MTEAAVVNVEVALESALVQVALTGDVVFGLEELGAAVTVQDGGVVVQLSLGDPSVAVEVGAAGAPGSRVFFGRGAPTLDALNGDYYRELNHGEWYERVSSVWAPKGGQLLAVLQAAEALPTLVANQRGAAYLPTGLVVDGSPVYDLRLSDGTD